MNTTLCYIEREGAYLMLHRTKKSNDINHDKWIAPGGKLEPGESPFDCVRREVLEETGLTTGALCYRGIITFVSDEAPTEYMHLFHTREVNGTVRECDEGTLEWIPKRAVYNLPMWEGDHIFLSLLEKPTPFFSLKLVYKGERLCSHTLDFAETTA